MLKLAVIGADRRTHKMLQLFFSGPGKQAGCLVSESEAEADIVDIAGFNGESVWQEHRALYRRPAIILSVDEKSFPGTIWVPKPIQKADFLKALSDLKLRVERAEAVAASDGMVVAGSALNVVNRFSAQEYSLAAGKALVDYRYEHLCGEYPDTVYLDQRYRSRLFYHPEHSLQYAVSRGIEFSRESGVSMSLSGLPQTITVFSSGRYVYCPYSPEQLRELTRHELSSRELTVTAMHEDFMVNEGDPHVIPAEKFLWESALLSSRGRVPFGTDMSQKVGLKAWPNLTRLVLTPHAMQLAAYWHVKPEGLRETAERLNIRYRYVYAFYSACSALGLVVPDAQALAQPEGRGTSFPGKGFLGRLLGYLGKFGV